MNILVTGGASGLGAEIVKTLAKDTGNVVYFTYAQSRAASKQLETAFPNAKGIYCDFTKSSSVNALTAELAQYDLDVLVNNAWGKMHKEHFHKTDPTLFLSSFEHNLMPVLKITQQALKGFRKKKFGKIINIVSSAVVNKPPIGWAEYTASKSYLLAMSTAWATEGIKFNITSNSISPAFMETALTSDTDSRVLEQMKEDHPLKRLLTTKEVAEAVFFFVYASQQINGTNFIINAGDNIG